MFMVCCSQFLAIPGFAEPLTGTVVAVDREKSEVILDVSPQQGKPQQVLITTDESLPACALPGTTMRAWGSFVGEDKTTFSATNLRGVRRHRDKTGVLARLSQHHPHSRQHSTGKSGYRSHRARRRHGRR